MGSCHRQTGGLRWGNSQGDSWNASWPFAELHATPAQLTIQLNVLGVVRRTFTVGAGELRRLEFRPRAWGLWGGLLLHHSASTQPAVLIFWTFRPRTLRRALARLGYPPIGP